MNKTVYRILTWLVLPAIIVLLCWVTVAGVLKPMQFEDEREAREAVGIRRLKDLRTIQSAFKSETGHYASTFDSLKTFYLDGKMTIDMQIGSQDDSLAVANTKALKKKKPKITPAEMLQRAEAGERLVFTIKSNIPVKDTLFHNRTDFAIDSIFVIPFSGGQPIEMKTTIKQVSGVPVPLFEACMPFWKLLKDMDRQLIVNLNADREDTGRYPGLMVGSVTAPNNNAGNWE